MDKTKIKTKEVWSANKWYLFFWNFIRDYDYLIGDMCNKTIFCDRYGRSISVALYFTTASYDLFIINNDDWRLYS